MVRVLMLVTNSVAGLMIVACGLLGVLSPELVADYYGFIYDLPQSKTTMRVLASLFVSSGLILLLAAVFGWWDQFGVLLCLVAVLLAFVFARVLGLSIDGWEQPGMLGELIFELCFLCWALLLFALYRLLLSR